MISKLRKNPQNQFRYHSCILFFENILNKEKLLLSFNCGAHKIGKPHSVNKSF